MSTNAHAADAFRARVRAALDAHGSGALAARFPAPLVTALVADAGEDARLLAAALGEVSAVLGRLGVPRGRQFVLLGGDPPAAGAEDRARALRGQLDLVVLLHSPARPGFVAGRLADGRPIELDDELREAEAIVTVGRWSAGADGPRGGVALLCPGVASAPTRAAYGAARARGAAAAWAFALEAERATPVDLSVAWDDPGRVLAAGGRDAFAAHARAALAP